MDAFFLVDLFVNFNTGFVTADGEVVKGRSTIDQASITGESVPAETAPGDEVFAGTINLTGAIEVKVSRAGQETTLGKVKELILKAESSRPQVARIIDRYVTWYLPLVLMLAFIILFFTRDPVRFIAALVVACPTARRVHVARRCPRSLEASAVLPSIAAGLVHEQPLRQESALAPAAAQQRQVLGRQLIARGRTRSGDAAVRLGRGWPNFRRRGGGWGGEAPLVSWARLRRRSS